MIRIVLAGTCLGSASAVALAPIALTTRSAAASTSQQQGPDYVVSHVVASGGGCASADTHVETLSDGRLVVTLDRMQVQVGNGIPAEESQKLCELALTLKHEPGWSYAVRTYEVLGQADLASAVSAGVRLWHHNDTRRPLKLAEALPGPVELFDYRLLSSQDRDRLSWSPCGQRQSLKLALALVLTPTGEQQGFLGQCGCGSPDIRLEILWRRCAMPPP